MSERTPETNHSKGPERSSELAEIAKEQLSKIESSQEKVHNKPENHSEQLESARNTIEAQAAPEPEPINTEKEQIQTPVTRFDLQQNYAHTLKSLQRTMTPVAKTFSRVIHNPAVEAVSEVAGKTVFRPSVTLGATTAATLLGGFVYFVARASGFELAGSEFWLALVVGGLIGLVIEFVYRSLALSGRFLKH
jgi:hypothetical protein